GDPLPPGAIARLGMTRLWHRSAVRGLIFSRDGRMVISADGTPRPGEEKTDIAFWDVGSGKRVRSLEGPPYGIGPLALSPDGQCLAWVSGGADGLGVYDLRTGCPSHQL